MNITYWLLKISKYTLITVGTVLLASVIICSLLLFTHTGNQAVISLAKQMESRLSIDLIEGSLFHSPKYKNIGWQDGDTNINIESLDYQFKWSCLTTELCLQSLNLDGVIVSIATPSKGTEPQEEVATTPLVIDLPIDININDITLSRLQFMMGELRVDLNEISLQADASGKDVSLASQIKGLLITLPDSEEAVVPSQNTNNIISKTNPKKKMDFSFSSLPAILTKQMLPTVTLPINLTVKPIVISEFKVVQDKNTIFEMNTLESALTFQDSQLSISQFALDIPETQVNMHGEINFIEDYPLNITIEGRVKTIKQLQPQTLLNALDYTLTSKGRLSDLSSKLTLSNKLNLQLDTHLDLLSNNLPHRIQLDWQNIQWPLTGKAQYASKKGRISAKGSLLDHHINLQTEYALADLPNGKVSLKTKGDLQKLQVESLKVETLSGEIDFSGLLTWKDNIDWLGQLSITDIDIKELQTDYDAHFSGIIKQKVAVVLYENSVPEWQFDFPELQIVGELLSRPLSLSGRVSGNDQQGITFDKLAIKNAHNTFIVNGLLAQENDLNIALNVLDISHAMVGAKGKVIGDIVLKGPFEALDITTNIKANALSYENYYLEKLNINSDITLTKKPKIKLALAASQLMLDKHIIDDVEVNINNKSGVDENTQHKINVSVNSELISTDLLLYSTQTNNNFLTELHQAKLYLPHQSISLTTPFHIIQEKNNINLTDHCWKVRASNESKLGEHDAGKLCIDEFNMGKKGNIAFAIDNYLIANMNPFLPEALKMDGALSANAKLKWKENSKPDFTMNIMSDDMLLKINNDPNTNIFNDYLMESFNIDIKGNEENIMFDANIFSDKLINVQVKGQVLPYESEPTIDSQLDISLPDFSLFLPIIPQLEKLGGQLTSQLTMTGDLKNPMVNGEINILNSHIGSASLPMKISDLQTTIQINNTEAIISGAFNTNDSHTIGEKVTKIPLLTDTLSLLDKSVKKVKGRITQSSKQNILMNTAQEIPGIAFIKGQFDWSNKLKGDLHFYAKKLEIYDYGKIDLSVSPDIKVHVEDYISVTGALFIDKGKIVVKELPEGAISESKDIIVIDVKKEKVADNLPIIIDLSLDMGKDFQLVALGLDSYINGNLLIKKRREKDLTINGELNFVDGSYRSLGQQLVLQKSRVIFQGAPEAPYLKIEAIRDPKKIQDGVIAGVRVTGEPDELELVIFSEPAMSQQEALSYLTRGQSIDGSSDSSTMANMLIDLAAGQSNGLMSSIGEEVGIKDLSLSSSGTGDEQSVGIRGEIAPGIEISYGVGVFDNFSIFAIRYEMFERFYVEASSGIDQAIDAYYEWDWD